MKIAYLDCLGGASGDMLLGALVDAGLSVEDLRADLSALDLPPWRLTAEKVKRGALSAVHVTVHSEETMPCRTRRELLGLLEGSSLPAAVAAKGATILNRLVEAEAAVHGQDPAAVHLHEIGSVDTVVDVVGTLLGFHRLGIGAIYASRLPLARGMIDSQHGPLPLPAPATLALLRNAPVRLVRDVEAELVTPTGAALVTELAQGFDECPPMTLRAIGCGAGSRELPFPNVLRLWVGEAAAPDGLIHETLVTLECNVDDMPAQQLGFVMERLLAEGALDVTLTPLQMKKGRPATALWVLVRLHDAARLAQLVLGETTTLGVRWREVERISLPREVTTVDTRFGPVRVKIAHLGPKARFSPEYDDCRKLALEAGVPLVDVERAAMEAIAQRPS